MNDLSEFSNGYYPLDEESGEPRYVPRLLSAEEIAILFNDGKGLAFPFSDEPVIVD